MNGNFNQNLPCSNDFQSSPVANCGNSTENYPSFESIFDEKNYYIAAVIDYVAITDAIMNSKMTVMQNLQNYVGIIQECGKFVSLAKPPSYNYTNLNFDCENVSSL